MRKLLAKIHLPNWLVGVLALVLLLRIPSFFEPYYYGDEMIYLTLGQGIRHGLSLYSQIFDNKPPLIYLVAALAGSLFWFKAILAFWNMATVIVFAKLAGKILQRGTRIATVIFALATTLPTLEGPTVNAELFMILPSLLAFYLLFSNSLKTKLLITAGILFGIATLFKVPAAFDAPVMIVYWFVSEGIKKWKAIFARAIFIAAGFTIPILVTFFWYGLNSILPLYIKTVFLQNIGYLGSLKPAIDVPIYWRGLIIAIGLGLIFAFRKSLSKKFILFSVWALFALFAAALSQRPYPHYLVQAAAPTAFLLAIFFSDKSREQALSVIPLALIFFVPFFYKYYDYQIFPYYSRFVKFATGKVNKDTYFASFSPHTKRNYEIANFLIESSHSGEKVFVWDPDSPTVYALSRRLPPIKFTAPYHIYDYSSKIEAAIKLSESPPKFIILTSGSPIPEIMNLVRQKYILIAQIENADIYSRFR